MRLPAATVHPALTVHRELLERWRGAMDLVGPGPLEPHFVDALAVATPLGACGAWADLGSGAGFPGLAIAALNPEATVTLVERRQKRAVFLRELAHACGLRNLRVHEGDTDQLAPGAWSGVSSRAYKPPLDYLRDATRLLAPGGQALLLTVDDPPAAPPLHLHRQWRYQVDGRERVAGLYRA